MSLFHDENVQQPLVDLVLAGRHIPNVVVDLTVSVLITEVLVAAGPLEVR